MLKMEQRQYQEAENLLCEATEGRIQKLKLQHQDTLRFINNLIDLYEAWGKSEQAEKWRAKLPE